MSLAARGALAAAFLASLAWGGRGPGPPPPWTCLFLLSVAQLAHLLIDCRRRAESLWESRPTQALFWLALAVYLSSFRWHGGDDIPTSLLPFSALRFGTLALDPFRDWIAARGLLQDFTVSAPPHVLSIFPVAPALMALPAYVLPVVFGAPIDEWLLHQLSKTSAALICAASVAVFHQAARLRASPSWALGASLLYAFGTAALSVSSQALYQHGPTQLAVAAGFWALLREPSGPRGLAWAGAAMGLAISCRYDTLLFAGPIGLVLLARRPLGQALAYAGGAAVPLSLLMLGYHWYYTGSLRPPDYTIQATLFTEFQWEALWAMLLSPTRGLLPLFPAGLFGIWALAVRLRDRRFPWAPALLFGAAATWVMYCFRLTWTGGGTFGNRYFAVLCLILALACAEAGASLAASPRARAAWAAAFALSVIVHASGAYFNWPGSFGVATQKATLWDWSLYPPINLFTKAGGLGGLPGPLRTLAALAFVGLAWPLYRVAWRLAAAEEPARPAEVGEPARVPPADPWLKRRRRALAAVAALSVLFHLKGLSAPVLDYHYHRQCNTAAIARNYHENGLRFLTPQIDWEGGYDGLSATEFPLYMWLTGLLWPLGGLGDLWGRILAVAFSALTAVYLVLLLERRLGTAPALCAGALFCVIPLEIFFGRTVQPEAIALFSAVAALRHWDAALDAWDGGGRRFQAQWLLAVAFAFLSIGHKIPYGHLLIPLAGLALLRRGARVLADPRFWAAGALAGAGVLAWYLHAGRGRYVVPSHPGEFLSILNYKHLPYFASYQFYSRLPEVGTTYGGLVLWLVGAVSLWRRGERFLFVWLGGAALLLVAGGGYTFHHEYTSLPMAPVSAALMGAGLWRLRESAGRAGRPARVLLALLVLSIPAHAIARLSHAGWYKQNYPFLLKARAAADAVSAPADLFVCNERGASVFLYYLHRKGWSWDLSEQGVERLPLLEQRIAEGAKFYMTHKNQDFTDPESPFRRHFSRFPVVYDKDEILIFKLR